LPPVVIADASPLIGLAKIGRLALLRQLYQRVLIPPAVHAELQAGSQRPGGVELLQALNEGWLTVADSADIPEAARAELKRVLDAGEADAIVLALQLSARLLLIDEQRGRAVAQLKGVPIAGTGVVLLTAKRLGYIREVKTELDALCQSGYRLSARLRQKLASMAGE
jgi:predicted nucleic acid-binding protein